MAAGVSNPPRPGVRADLGGLAEAIQRAFGADAVLIGARAPGDEVALATPAAPDSEGLPATRAAVRSLMPALVEAGELYLPRLAESELPGSAKLVEQGYGALVGVALALEGAALGELIVLRRAAGELDNAELIGAFGRQAAIALDHPDLRRRTASLTARLEQLEALDQVALSSASFDELSEALQSALEPIFGAEMTGVMVWDANRKVLQMVSGSFGADEQTAASYQIDPSDPHSNAGRVFTTGRPYISNDAAGDPGILQGYVRAFRIRRLISLRLAVSGRPTGVLHLANKETDFRVEDLRRAERLTPRIATVVELTRTMLQLRRKEQLESVLSGAAVEIASGRSVLDFLPRALEGLARTLEAGMIALVPEGSDPIVHRRDETHRELMKTILDEAQEAAGVRAYVVGPARAGDPGRAVFHTPVNAGRQRVGTLTALRLRSESFSREERIALGRVAHLAALGWASERYQRQRAELARLHERQRIADELHDQVAQILVAAQLGLDTILELPGLDPDLAVALARSRGLLVRGDTAIRTVIEQLGQPAAGDFGSRLTDTVTAIEDEFAMPVHLEVGDQAAAAAERLRRPVGEALLKVVRESLVNAAKHAGPCRATVRLDLGRTGALRVRIVDDGVGATGATAAGHGLVSVRRTLSLHGGRLQVRRGAAGGTTVMASIPVG
jgi:signal transduction histidine kinase